MKLQLKVQKAISIIVLITCVMAFLFSLGLTTDLYKLMLTSAVGSIDGSEIFDDIQPFNKQLVNAAILMIVAAIFLFITRTHVRRRYYISNYISIILIVILNVFISIWALINITGFKQRFVNEVDFEAWFALRDIIPNFVYTESTLWLDFNIIVYFMVLISSFLLLGNLIWKIMLMKYEDKLLNGEIKPGNNSIAKGVS